MSPWDGLSTHHGGHLRRRRHMLVPDIRPRGRHRWPAQAPSAVIARAGLFHHEVLASRPRSCWRFHWRRGMAADRGPPPAPMARRHGGKRREPRSSPDPRLAPRHETRRGPKRRRCPCHGATDDLGRERREWPCGLGCGWPWRRAAGEYVPPLTGATGGHTHTCPGRAPMTELTTPRRCAIGDQRRPTFSAPETTPAVEVLEWAGRQLGHPRRTPADFTPVCTTEFVGFRGSARAFGPRGSRQAVQAHRQLGGQHRQPHRVAVATARRTPQGTRCPSPMIADPGPGR